jgi:hypothetical protein
VEWRGDIGEGRNEPAVKVAAEVGSFEGLGDTAVSSSWAGVHNGAECRQKEKTLGLHGGGILWEARLSRPRSPG